MQKNERRINIDNILGLFTLCFFLLYAIFLFVFYFFLQSNVSDLSFPFSSSLVIDEAIVNTDFDRLLNLFKIVIENNNEMRQEVVKLYTKIDEMRAVNVELSAQVEANNSEVKAAWAKGFVVGLVFPFGCAIVLACINAYIRSR